MIVIVPNKAHVEIVKRGSEAISDWREKNPEEQLKLANAILPGADLRLANLRGAELKGARLTGADLTQANFRGANLHHADLCEADLRGADLRDADLSNAELRSAIFDESTQVEDRWRLVRRIATNGARGENLTQADIRGASLTGVTLQGAILSDADLRGADLSKADLREADMSRANLEDAILDKVDLRKATLCESYLVRISCQEGDLRGADLRKATLLDAHLSATDLRRTRLSRAYLNGAQLEHADLRYSRLNRAILSDAVLREADLTKADLRGANLHGANLRGANLNEANVSKANLTGADLRDANLSDANLSDAFLVGANLNETNLNGTNLGSCIAGSTVFADIDLSKTSNLETVQHMGPSIVDVKTLYKSKGKIPMMFLRGCGVPDSMITYLSELVGTAFEYFTCFISFTEWDDEFSKRLYSDLQGEGVRCWRWKEDAKWGTSLMREVDQAVQTYDKLVVILSKHSLSAEPVIREIERALQKEQRDRREVLFPVRLDDTVFSWNHELQPDVVRKNVGDFRKWRNDENYLESFKKLLDSLQQPRRTPE